jgi:hypothetical protein
MWMIFYRGSRTVKQNVERKIQRRKSAHMIAQKRGEKLWRKPDFKTESFVPRYQTLQSFAEFTWRKQKATLLHIFLSFFPTVLITDILNSYGADHWTIHSLPNSNTITITTSMIYESLALQIYLIGQQNYHARSRSRSHNDAKRPLRSDIQNARDFFRNHFDNIAHFPIGIEAHETIISRFNIDRQWMDALSNNFRSVVRYLSW